MTDFAGVCIQPRPDFVFEGCGQWLPAWFGINSRINGCSGAVLALGVEQPEEFP